MLEVRENEISLRKLSAGYCAVAHLRGNIGYHPPITTFHFSIELHHKTSALPPTYNYCIPPSRDQYAAFSVEASDPPQ